MLVYKVLNNNTLFSWQQYWKMAESHYSRIVEEYANMGILGEHSFR